MNGLPLSWGLRRALLQKAPRIWRRRLIDASICDGSALLAALIHGWRSSGLCNAEAGSNNGDGGAHFYDAYACADGRYISIGTIEPQFYALLREKCGLRDAAFDGNRIRPNGRRLSAFSPLRVGLESVAQLVQRGLRQQNLAPARVPRFERRAHHAWASGTLVAVDGKDGALPVNGCFQMSRNGGQGPLPSLTFSHRMSATLRKLTLAL
ncbi:MAG: hypothetical protein EOP82_03840 [Variovorax sp.]|nr:MAG: hypothetical protein EOP82_03840 [Variovorax sp.]